MQMQPPITKKQIQALTSKLVASNRLISQYSYHLWLFFTTLKGVSSKGWGPECEKAFHAVKEYLASPLTSSKPIEGKEIYLYLIASATVSTTLVRLDEDEKQRLVYFMSKMLTDAKTRYIDFEQIELALMMVAKKLHHYFQAHAIIVLTSYPIRAIIYKLAALG